MNVKTPGLQFYVDKLNADELFTFVRYGNGEWDLVLGRGSRTGSGSQTFSPSLRVAMRKTLADTRNGDYYYAMQSRTYLKRLGLLPKAQRWLAENTSKIDWYNADVFHKNNQRAQLAPLIDVLRRRFVVIVGPPWLERLPFADAMVRLRPRNCWQDVDAIAAQVRMYRDCVVSFSAGPTAKVLIHRLWPEMGDHSWLIDFGSLWDVYCGKRSRRYHKRMGKDVIRENLGQSS